MKNHKRLKICREILRVLASNIFGGQLIHPGKNMRSERKILTASHLKPYKKLLQAPFSSSLSSSIILPYQLHHLPNKTLSDEKFLQQPQTRQNFHRDTIAFPKPFPNLSQTIPKKNKNHKIKTEILIIGDKPNNLSTIIKI